MSTPMTPQNRAAAWCPRLRSGGANVAELAAAVAYLVSDGASSVTGTELVINGGFRTR